MSRSDNTSMTEKLCESVFEAENERVSRVVAHLATLLKGEHEAFYDIPEADKMNIEEYGVPASSVSVMDFMQKDITSLRRFVERYHAEGMTVDDTRELVIQANNKYLQEEHWEIDTDDVEGRGLEYINRGGVMLSAGAHSNLSGLSSLVEELVDDQYVHYHNYLGREDAIEAMTPLRGNLVSHSGYPVGAMEDLFDRKAREAFKEIGGEADRQTAQKGAKEMKHEGDTEEFDDHDYGALFTMKKHGFPAPLANAVAVAPHLSDGDKKPTITKDGKTSDIFGYYAVMASKLGLFAGVFVKDDSSDLGIKPVHLRYFFSPLEFLPYSDLLQEEMQNKGLDIGREAVPYMVDIATGRKPKKGSLIQPENILWGIMGANLLSGAIKNHNIFNYSTIEHSVKMREFLYEEIEKMAEVDSEVRAMLAKHKPDISKGEEFADFVAILLREIESSDGTQAPTSISSVTVLDEDRQGMPLQVQPFRDINKKIKYEINGLTDTLAKAYDYLEDDGHTLGLQISDIVLSTLNN